MPAKLRFETMKRSKYHVGSARYSRRFGIGGRVRPQQTRRGTCCHTLARLHDCYSCVYRCVSMVVEKYVQTRCFLLPCLPFARSAPIPVRSQQKMVGARGITHVSMCAHSRPNEGLPIASNRHGCGGGEPERKRSAPADTATDLGTRLAGPKPGETDAKKTVPAMSVGPEVVKASSEQVWLLASPIDGSYNRRPHQSNELEQGGVEVCVAGARSALEQGKKKRKTSEEGMREKVGNSKGDDLTGKMPQKQGKACERRSRRCDADDGETAKGSNTCARASRGSSRKSAQAATHMFQALVCKDVRGVKQRTLTENPQSTGSKTAAVSVASSSDFDDHSPVGSDSDESKLVQRHEEVAAAAREVRCEGGGERCEHLAATATVTVSSGQDSSGLDSSESDVDDHRRAYYKNYKNVLKVNALQESRAEASDCAVPAPVNGGVSRVAGGCPEMDVMAHRGPTVPVSDHGGQGAQRDRSHAHNSCEQGPVPGGPCGIEAYKHASQRKGPEVGRRQRKLLWSVLVGDSASSRGQFLDPQSRAPNHAARGHRPDAVFSLGGHDISKFGGALSAHPCSTQARITRDLGEGMPSVDCRIFGGATLVPTGPGKPHMIQELKMGEKWQSSEHLAPGDLLLGIDDVDVTLFSFKDIQAKMSEHQSIVKLTLARNHVRTQVTIRRLDGRQVRSEYPGSYGHQIPPHTQPQQHSVVGPSARIHPAGGKATPRMQSLVNLGEIVRGQTTHSMAEPKTVGRSRSSAAR